MKNEQSVPQVSQSLGISESLLYKWRTELSEGTTEESSLLQEYWVPNTREMDLCSRYIVGWTLKTHMQGFLIFFESRQRRD